MKPYEIQTVASIVVPYGDVQRLTSGEESVSEVLTKYGVAHWDYGADANNNPNVHMLKAYGPKEALATLKYDLDKVRWRT